MVTMEASNTSPFMRSETDHATHISICKKCLATVADAPTESELDRKELDHVCKELLLVRQ
jgi:hypothetical protein